MGCSNSNTSNAVAKDDTPTKDAASEEEGMVEKFSCTAQGSGIMGDTKVQITGTDWTFLIDEPVEDGGKNQGANPMQTFVSSLVGCENEQAAVVAGEMEMKIDQIEWTVDVDLNLAGFAGKDLSLKQPFVSAVITAAVTTEATEEQVKELGDAVGARCPIRQLLINSGVQVEGHFVKPGGSALPETKAKEDNELVERFSATAQGSGIMGDTKVQINGTDWELLLDEPTEDGGKNQGSNPMQHFIASLISCDNEQAAVVAAEMGVKIERIEWTADVELDLAGFMGKDLSLKQPFVSAVIKAKVTSNGTDEQVKQLGEFVGARCPVRRLLVNSGVNVESSFIKA